MDIRDIEYPKHLTMLAFIILAIRASNKVIVFGMIFGMIGDILLMVSEFLDADEDTKKLYFAIGAGSFLIGHVLYTVNNFRIRNQQAFHEAKQRTKIVLIVVSLAILALYLFQLIYYQFFKKVEFQNMLIVALYGVFLTIMVESSIITYNSTCNPKYPNRVQFWMRLIGSIFFMISDSSIMYGIVFKHGDHPFTRYFVVITYDIAQLLIL